jgi:hypothetical protein
MAVYDVYTMERPGRPGLALAISAGLLVLTVVLAGALVAHRNRSVEVPLGKDHTIPGWAVSFRPPQGWHAVPLKDAPDSVGAAWREPGGLRREVAFVRGPKASGPWPLREADELVDKAVLWLADADRARQASRSSGRFGGLPATIAMWQAVSREGGVCEVLGCLTTLPDRTVYGVLLSRPDIVDRMDERLLDYLAAHATIPDTVATSDVNAVAEAGGLALTLPHASLAARPTPATVPRPAGGLTLISSADAREPWRLDLQYIPLASGRDARALLEDTLRATLRQPALGAEVETLKFGSRTVHRAALSARNRAWRYEIWMAPIDETSAIRLIGRGEGTGQTLPQVCQSVAKTVSLTANAARIDVAAAEARGAAVLADIRTRGLSTWLRKWAEADLLYLLEDADTARGYQRMSYERDTRQRRPVWHAAVEYHRESDDGTLQAYKSDTFIEEDGRQYNAAASRSEGRGAHGIGPDVERERYEESDNPERNIVQRTLTTERQPYTSTIQPDANFAPDAILDVVSWLVATDPELRPAIVTSTDWYEANPGRNGSDRLPDLLLRNLLRRRRHPTGAGPRRRADTPALHSGRDRGGLPDGLGGSHDGALVKD